MSVLGEDEKIRRDFEEEKNPSVIIYLLGFVMWAASFPKLITHVLCIQILEIKIIYTVLGPQPATQSSYNSNSNMAQCSVAIRKGFVKVAPILLATYVSFYK